MSKTKVLLCGATGFIGRNVIERLAAREDLEVHGTYFKNAPASDLSASGKVALVQVDLTNREQVNRVVEGKQIIIQAAAVTTGSKDTTARPYIHVTDNAVMNSLVFRAAFEHRVQHVVFFSCTVMYPDLERPVKEEDFDGHIEDHYFGIGWTKVYAEKMCEFYSRIGATKYTAVRHSNVYGPYDKYDLDRSHVFGATVAKVMAATDGRISVWGDGSERRDLLYVSDLVDFVETIVDAQTAPFELINLGYGSAISVKELVEKIVRSSGKDLEIAFDTSQPNIKFGLALDVSRARQKYHWQPKVSLEDGIKQTLSWYAANVAAR